MAVGWSSLTRITRIGRGGGTDRSASGLLGAICYHTSPFDRQKERHVRWGSIQQERAMLELSNALSPLIGVEISYLKLPPEAARQFEPSQIGTIVGTLTDAVLASIASSKPVGLRKGPGILGSREGYPDFLHESGYRIELKGLFCDNPSVALKKPPTRREPSARLTQKVTLNNVAPDADALLILSYHLHPASEGGSLLTPVIRDLGIFPVIECVRARDFRLAEGGGRWFGNYQTPAILSKQGKAKLARGEPLDITSYGRKESEQKDFNEDTNFGKLKRIPYKPLQEFLARNGAHFAARGAYPAPWAISGYEGTESTDDD